MSRVFCATRSNRHFGYSSAARTASGRPGSDRASGPRGPSPGVPLSAHRGRWSGHPTRLPAPLRWRATVVYNANREGSRNKSELFVRIIYTASNRPMEPEYGISTAEDISGESRCAGQLSRGHRCYTICCVCCQTLQLGGRGRGPPGRPYCGRPSAYTLPSSALAMIACAPPPRGPPEAKAMMLPAARNR